METTTYKRTKTTDFFYKINLLVYFFGLPNFWIEDLKLPKLFVKIFDRFKSVINFLISALILFELGGFFTQNNLTQKQKSNHVVFAISQPMLNFFRIIMAGQQKKVRAVLYDLTVGLKRVYNDPEVEKEMIRSTKMYVFALVFSCCLSMVMYMIDACWEVVRDDVTFTTLVTAYPDVEDKSLLANIVRVIVNVIWWIFVTRILGLYMLVIPLATCLSHQYRNLQSYFLSLNNIFARIDLSQTEKEVMYEEGFKVGIKIHADTLRCTVQTQAVCRGVFSGQIIFNILLLVVLMAQMVNSERTLVNLCSTVMTASAVLITTGFYMWNAGDVTVDASHLGTAIFFSGWENCQGRFSVRVRKLVVITMAHAQRPVVLKGLGYIDLSYQSYIRIVKSSYSVFSVLF